ncbi:cation diffusion facilitator family transporter [Croceicoccus naphthovorans]|uniref:Ferrous iron transporter n=1 Tax=Croceicoccus naphthovorans TaxID=1348774 RepID=A0A0G3XJ03_9SPHN|nr:cation diffusion facilitator family transporter [Croceicoccus naphthovorans]AKM11167.1 ferrous iron transporter [Croceicoccus naphthovorans]MBB3989947.1 ferrous-iron efflux pump FieF [Croceicoccus naphthovorans]
MATLSEPAPARTAAEERALLTRSAAMASMSVALLLLALKIFATIQTGSTAMLGSLADTALDLVASLVTLIGVWVAAQPADADHRFGHGKAEALAALVQVVLISISAVGLAARSIDMWIGGGRTEAAETGIGVSIIAMGATLLLLAWQRHVIKRTNSLAIQTDHVHYKSDILLNFGVIAALVLDQYAGITGADPVFGLIIALWLGWNAWEASQQAVDNLMDREWPVEKRQRLLDTIRDNPDLHGVHDLRTRTAGHRDFAQFHITVDPHMTVAEAHDVMDAIEAKLLARFPDTEFLIHTDPEGHIEPDAPKPVDLLSEGVDADFPEEKPA